MASVLAQRALQTLQRMALLRRLPLPALAVRRLAVAIPVIFGVTLLTFLVLDVLPGNAAQQLLGATATPEQVAALEERLNLNRPTSERYLEWLLNALRGDLGQSIASAQPVSDVVADRLLLSAELVAWASLLSMALSVPLSLLAARRPNGAVDRTITVFSMAGLSLASFVLAPLLVLLFSRTLSLLPSIGFVPLSEGVLPHFRSIVLPVTALMLPLACLYTRFLRGDLLEQTSGQDYVLTAYAKGMSRGTVLVRHVLRNSLLGLVTVVALNFGMLVGGAVVVEQIFAIPGIGQLLLQAINTRDAPIVQAVVLLIAVVTVLANLSVDLLYTVVDPRIRYGSE